MTDYVKSTNFTSKDSLASGNPLKIVKGAEFDTEFTNIATAVATKADLNSPVLIGVPTAPTAADGTNTTQLANTAFVRNSLMASVYPIGSLYLNATVSTNPATLLGFGTWTAFGAGRMPVGFDSTDPLFDTAEETGGSKDASLVSHSHSITIDAVADHLHYVGSSDSGTNPGTTAGLREFVNNYGEGNGPATATNPAGGHTHTASSGTAGSSATNANLPPYITVYMWKRTA